MYVYAACIIVCTATSAACYVTRRCNEIDKQSREQFTGAAIAAALAAAALATATLGLCQHESATGHQLAALSVAVPRTTNVYTILCSLVVVSLPSITLEPAPMHHHQLNSSWEETCTIMASGRRVMAPGETTLREIKKLAKAKHTPTDLRKACNEMKKAAANSHKAIMAQRQTQADHWRAETKKAMAEAEKIRQTSPKGAPKPAIPGIWLSCEDATATIGSCPLQQGQECVLLMDTNGFVERAHSRRQAWVAEGVWAVLSLPSVRMRLSALVKKEEEFGR